MRPFPLHHGLELPAHLHPDRPWWCPGYDWSLRGSVPGRWQKLERADQKCVTRRDIDTRTSTYGRFLSSETYDALPDNLWSDWSSFKTIHDADNPKLPLDELLAKIDREHPLEPPTVFPGQVWLVQAHGIIEQRLVTVVDQTSCTVGPERLSKRQLLSIGWLVSDPRIAGGWAFWSGL